MSLAILYRGKKISFSMRLSRRRVAVLSGLIAFAALSVWQPWNNSEQVSARFAQKQIDQERLEIAHQSEAVVQLRRTTERELSALTMKVGELQAQIMRLEAYGQRIAGTGDSAVDFSEPLPVGGPDMNHGAWPVTTDHHLLNQIDEMLELLEDKQNQLVHLETAMRSHHIDEERFIAGRPITSGWLSSQYGIRKDPFNGNPTMHRGIDFAGEKGSPVVATGAGIVTFAGRRGAYGHLIEIDHGGGLKTRYAHLGKLKVQPGDVVTRGQQIAEIGMTGRSTGPHVHYELIENGKHVNPSRYVSRHAPGE